MDIIGHSFKLDRYKNICLNIKYPFDLFAQRQSNVHITIRNAIKARKVGIPLQYGQSSLFKATKVKAF